MSSDTGNAKYSQEKLYWPNLRINLRNIFRSVNILENLQPKFVLTYSPTLNLSLLESTCPVHPPLSVLFSSTGGAILFPLPIYILIKGSIDSQYCEPKTHFPFFTLGTSISTSSKPSSVTNPAGRFFRRISLLIILFFKLLIQYVSFIFIQYHCSMH